MADEVFQVKRVDLKTPDEWCHIEGVEVLDPDGWRGRHGRPWTDPISLAEFRDRLVTCTQRFVAGPDDRTEMEKARQIGLERRQEQRLARATYTAAEVKVLTETAGKVAYALGRKDAGEEIAAEIEARAAIHSNGAVALSLRGAAIATREIASQPRQDATSGRTDPASEETP